MGWRAVFLVAMAIFCLVVSHETNPALARLKSRAASKSDHAKLSAAPVLAKLSERVHQEQKTRDPTAEDLVYLRMFTDTLPYTWADIPTHTIATVGAIMNTNTRNLRKYYLNPDDATLPADLHKTTGRAENVKAWIDKLRTFVHALVPEGTATPNPAYSNVPNGPQLTIAGAGPSGLSSALHALQLHKFAITLYEARCDFVRQYPVDLHPGNTATTNFGDDGAGNGMLGLVRKLGLVGAATADSNPGTEIGKHFGYHSLSLAMNRIPIYRLQLFLAACFTIASGENIQFGKKVYEVRPAAAPANPVAATNNFELKTDACAQQFTDKKILRRTEAADDRFFKAIKYAIATAKGSTDTAGWTLTGLAQASSEAANAAEQLDAPGTNPALAYSRFLVLAMGGGMSESFPYPIVTNIASDKLEQARQRHGPIMFFVYIFKDPNYETCEVIRTRTIPNFATSNPGMISPLFSKRHHAGATALCTLEVPFRAEASSRLRKIMVHPTEGSFYFPKARLVLPLLPPADGSDPTYGPATEVTKLTIMYRALKALDVGLQAGDQIADKIFAAQGRLLEAKAYLNHFRLTTPSAWGRKISQQVPAALPADPPVTVHGAVLSVGDTLRDAFPQFAMGVNEGAIHGLLLRKAMEEGAASSYELTVAKYQAKFRYEAEDLVPAIQALALTSLYTTGITDGTPAYAAMIPLGALTYALNDGTEIRDREASVRGIQRLTPACGEPPTTSASSYFIAKRMDGGGARAAEKAGIFCSWDTASTECKLQAWWHQFPR